MKLIISVLLTLLMIIDLDAFPRWAVQEDASCGTCHQFQSGGGARNSYGQDFVGETLVSRSLRLPWQREDSESAFSYGLDMRYMFIGQTDRDLRHFPMQFALYGGFELAGLIGHAELSRLQEDFRITGGIRYEGLPLEGYIAVQREMPALGWRMDDHTLYTRGGNLTPLTFSREGLPFTPYLEPPGYLELGSAPLPGLEFTVMKGTAFLNAELSDGGGFFQAGKAAYRYGGNAFNVLFSAGLQQESDIDLMVADVGLSAYGITYLGELAQISGWPTPDDVSQAVLHEVSYRLLKGVELIGRYEFFDPDVNFVSGSLQRLSLGVDLFPIPGLEMKISYRDASFDLPDVEVESTPQVLTQIHFYF